MRRCSGLQQVEQGLAGAVAIDLEVGIDRQQVLELQPRSGFGDGGVGQIERQAGKTLADAQHLGQRAVDRAVERQAATLAPAQKVQRGIVVDAPCQQRADLGGHTPGADQRGRRVGLQPAAAPARASGHRR